MEAYMLKDRVPIDSHPEPIARAVRRAPNFYPVHRECYWNSKMFCWKSKLDARYEEGWVSHATLNHGIHHGWIRYEGEIVDLTQPDYPKREDISFVPLISVSSEARAFDLLMKARHRWFSFLTTLPSGIYKDGEAKLNTWRIQTLRHANLPRLKKATQNIVEAIGCSSDKKCNAKIDIRLQEKVGESFQQLFAEVTSNENLVDIPYTPEGKGLAEEFAWESPEDLQNIDLFALLDVL